MTYYEATVKISMIKEEALNTALSIYWPDFSILIVYLIGITISVIRFKNQPKVSVLSLIGFFILALASMTSIIYTYWLLSNGESYAQSTITFIDQLSKFLSLLLHWAGWSSIILAIFWGRKLK